MKEKVRTSKHEWIYKNLTQWGTDESLGLHLEEVHIYTNSVMDNFERKVFLKHITAFS